MEITYFIVTGGNSVFLITEEKNVERVRNVALEHSREIYLLKVAGGARVIQTGDSKL